MLKNTIVLIFTLCLFYLANGQDDDDAAVSYDMNTFEEASANKNVFVMFFAPWCGHCKKMKPTWSDLAKEMNVEGKTVTIGKVDCTMHRELCSKHGVSGYPTVKFFAPGKESVRYSSQRNLESFKAFIQEQLGEAQAPQDTDAAAGKPAEATNGLYSLTVDNFDAHIKKGHHFVKFYAPWCGHCKKLAPVWESTAATFKDNKKVTISKVDCTMNQKICSDQGVRGYPTLIWFTDGKQFETYKQGRSQDVIHGYISKMISIESEEVKTIFDGKIPQVLDDLKDLNLVDLTDDDFEATVSEHFTFVMFLDKDCKSGDLVRPTLEELGEKFAEKTEYLFAAVYCDTQKNTCTKEEVVGPYPLFRLYFNGKVVETYTGDRTVAALEGYMAKKEKELMPQGVDHGGEL